MPLALLPGGLHANRPTSGSQGQFWFSTDVTGGTLYTYRSGQWVQVASGVGAAGGLTAYDATIDFGQGADAVTLDVADTSVTSSTIIVGSLLPGTGRDADELEMEHIETQISVTDGVGFTIYAHNPTGGAHDQYIYRYAKG